MKSNHRTRRKHPAPGPLEFALPALPFLALTPNFFIIPDLTLLGLATQEFVFSIAVTITAIIGLAQIVSSRSDPLSINRACLRMLAALGAFILLQAASLAWAPSPYEGMRNTVIWLGFAVFFTAGLFTLQKRSAIWLHYSITAVCAILAISILYERAKYGYIMLGVFFNHGISSELIALALPLQILNYLCSEKRGLALVSLVVSALSFVALFVGMRRGAIIGITVILASIGIMLAFGLIKLHSKRRILIVLALFAVAGTAVGWHFREEITYRIQGATQLHSREGGLTSRARMWITAWEMGKRHAIFGVGVAGYSSLYGSYRRFFVSDPLYAKVAEMAGPEDDDEIRSPLVHNEYLQTFVELGLVGLLLFVSFWFQVLWRLWQSRHEPQNHWILGALLGLISFGISSTLSAFSMRLTPAAFILACLLGIGFSFAKRNSDEADPSQAHLPLAKLAKTVAVVCIGVTLVACLFFIRRTYSVFASQKLQGRSTSSEEPLDFAFYPNNVAGNESLERRYQQVLDYDPFNAGAHLGYALLLFQMKNPTKAIPHAEFALKNGYSRPFAYVLLAFAYEQNRELSKASHVLSDCVHSFPQSTFARAAYAEILRKEARIDQMRDQQTAMYRLNEALAKSWELALRMKREPATSEAGRLGLTPPDKLTPRLASALVGMRAYHYLD